MAANQQDKPSGGQQPQGGPSSTPRLQDIIAKQKAKLQEKLKERAAMEAPPPADRSDSPAEAVSPQPAAAAQSARPASGAAGGTESSQPPADPGQAGAQGAPKPRGEPDSPEVAQARIDAVMEARARGASKEEAQEEGEAAAAAAKTRLGVRQKPQPNQDKAQSPQPDAPPADQPRDEDPAVAAARKEAYDEAIARGATEEEARSEAEAAAEMAEADLEYQARKSAEAEALAREAAMESGADDEADPFLRRGDGSQGYPSASAALAGGASAAVAGGRRLSLLQIVLLMNTGLILLVVGSMLGWLPGRLGGPASPVAVPAAIPAPEQPKKPLEEPSGSLEPGTVLSVPWAQRALTDRKYEEALERYRHLLAAAKSDRTRDCTVDFFRLRIAQCLRYLRQAKEARALYEEVSAGGSGIVAATANYQMALMDASQGQYLQARMRAYRAIAALNALKAPSPLEGDCDFLIAQTLTQRVSKFYPASEFIPWPVREETDPFAELEERELIELLGDNAGTDKPAAVDVQVQAAGQAGEAVRQWSVTCVQAPLEEVLNRFASAESGDVKWMAVNPAVRSRAVTLRVRQMPARRFNEVVCGMAGLIARFAADGTIEVHDPHAYTVMSEQRDLLGREAESVWRAFFLRSHNDPRVAAGRFAVAALSEWSGDEANALREYEMVSRRFRRDDAAPRALVRCARIRTEILRDYLGARQDLLDLLNMWPEYGQSAEVNVILGETCLAAGLLDQAVDVFRKLYHLNLSAESRRQACMGAGECFYRKGDFREASRWLALYISLPDSSGRESLAEAYLMLGKCQEALEDMDAAAVAFQKAAAWAPPGRLGIEGALGLAKVQIAREDFVSAIGALESLKNKPLDASQTRRQVLLKAQALRGMGLATRAQFALAGVLKLGTFTDPEARAEVLVELARCCMDAGSLDDARKCLLEALPKLQSGQSSWEARLALADVCLKLGKADQAIAIANELRQTARRAPTAVRQQAREALVRGYVMQQDYTGAAKALSEPDASPKGASQ